MTITQKILKSEELEINDGQIKGVPSNPRLITNERFEQLKKSISEDPDFLKIRELVVYPMRGGRYCIIGGNMRYRAAKELGITEFNCKILDRITSAELRSFLIKDNVQFGEFDFDMLQGDWSLPELEKFGIEDIRAVFGEEEDDNDGGESFGGGGDDEESGIYSPAVVGAEDEDGDNDDDDEDYDNSDPSSYRTFSGETLKSKQEEIDSGAYRKFTSSNEFDIPDLLPDMQATEVDTAFVGIQSCRGWLDIARTLHFYTDDAKFTKLIRQPNQILGAKIERIVEPNFSTSNNGDIALMLGDIFWKRWLARFYQEHGIKVFVDLNVCSKMDKYNLIGVPKGWSSFATRCRSSELDRLKQKIEIAREVSGKKTPLFICYGGGNDIKMYCKENNIYYIDSLFCKTKEI